MSKKSEVYFLPWDENKKIPRLIEKLSLNASIKKDTFVAIKIHFGEKGTKAYIKPQYALYFAKAVKELKGKPFFTDTNTIYRGSRSDGVSHLQTAAGHGFKPEGIGAPVIIADGITSQDYVNVEINQNHFTEVKIAGAIHNADAMICLSHTKGHLLFGYGGAIKNLGMGCAARPGKFEMHCDATPTMQAKFCTACGLCIEHCPASALALTKKQIVMDKSKCVGCGDCIHYCPKKVFDLGWDTPAMGVCEKAVEYALGAVKNKPVFYFNFVNNITKECDCLTCQEAPLLPDIGILASMDPVAIDKASIDLINKEAGYDFFKKVQPSADAEFHIKYAEKLGLGSTNYELKFES